jgi:hypothetical protein
MGEAVVADPSQLRPGFDPSSVRVGFVVNNVALEQVSFLQLTSSYVNEIVSMVRIYSFIYHKGCTIVVAHGGQPATTPLS